MIPIVAASAAGAWWMDLRTFAADVRFERPFLFWLALAPIAWSILGLAAAKSKRRKLAAFGKPASLYALQTLRRKPSRWVPWFAGVAWSLLVLAVAGPNWGQGERDGVAEGRDIVAVLDLSKSMLAKDLAGTQSRWQAAVDGLRELNRAAKRRSGHRIGIVIFAARPAILLPATTDHQHIDFKLLDIDGEQQPNDIRPKDDFDVSGTRIGLALKLAVKLHDERFEGARDIVLFTDADDPEADREWLGGVSSARAAGIPVHVVGVGDPGQSHTLLISGEKEEAISTKLFEDVAESIAAEGQGTYVPMRREPFDAEAFFRQAIDGRSKRLIDDESRVQRKDRSAWFYATGGLFLVLAWWRGRSTGAE